MRAATVTAPGTVAIVSVAVAQPGVGEVRIKLQGCGVCASNLTSWAGAEWIQYPVEPGDLGHEGWGVIDAIGPGVTTLNPGDRVAALSYKAYAEYDVAKEAAVLRLPEELASTPFPGEPLSCAMNIFRRADIRSGQTVAIVGIGFLGSLLTQLSVAAGARVIAISRRDYARTLAQKLGAPIALAFTGDRGPIVAEVLALTDARLCERVIEATGRQDALDLAGELTGEGGRLIIAGYHQDGPRSVNMQLWNWRGIDVINAHERDPDRYMDGMRQAVAAVLEGRIDPSPLMTHRYALDDLGRALNDTRDRPDGFLKALVIYP